MGLTIEARSKKSHYSERLEDYTGSIYNSVDIGYFGFRFFRNALLTHFSKGELTDIVESKVMGESLSYCWFNDNYVVLMKKEDFEDFNTDIERKRLYLDKIKYIKKHWPKVYELYPLLVHCDGEGEIPYEQCKMILPLLKEFYEIDNKNYGYSERDYNFTKEFIKVVTEAVKHKGKLLFC